MSNSLMNSTTQIDTTLTKNGYAADAKIVGDKLDMKQNKIVLKSVYFSTNTDEYAQIALPVPNDAIVIIGLTSIDVAFFPMSLSLSDASWRCVKNLSSLQWTFAVSSKIDVTMWYLAVESN